MVTSAELAMDYPKIKLDDIRGCVVANANLNIRRGAPNTEAEIASKIPIGTTLTVLASYEGQNVSGNSRWYAGEGDIFFWSGGTRNWVVEPTQGATLIVPRRDNGTIRPLRDAEIRAAYGDILVTELVGGQVKLDDNWVTDNIIEMTTPFLQRTGFAKMRLHRKAEAAFQQVFDAISAKGLESAILTCGGTWVPRHKGWNAARELSSHTWGIAIDLNVAWNGYGHTPAALTEQGSVRQLVSYLRPLDLPGAAILNRFQFAMECISS